MLWGGESSERVRLEYPGEGTHPMHQETFELNCFTHLACHEWHIGCGSGDEPIHLVGLCRSARLGTTSDDEDVG